MRQVIEIHFKEEWAKPVRTEINGTRESIKEYYYQDGGKLNIGLGPVDAVATIKEILFLDA